ncbi:MAG: DUF4124 domain-containing protein [Myxococcus sp.]|nr:DUF4124 domain-containing protein [Myxococcus sp.]
MLRLGLLSVVVASVASAQVYTWTDKDGVDHFTDNPSSVPANVKAKVTTGDDISTVTLGEVRPAVAALPPRAQAAPAPADPGRAEREWRAAFRDVNERIARLEDEIEVDRKKVEDVNGLPVAARYQCLNGLGAGGWMAPGAFVSGAGASVSLGATSQGVPGFAVGLGVVQTSQVVVANPGVVTTPCIFALNPEFERARERLELNRKALARARTELADLDRRAGFEAVPRDWRR